jgi:diguanylate cyclase (GGDEF)-like protein
MLRIDPARLRTALEQLHQATRDHAEWQETLLRAIVRGLPSDSIDLADGAHVSCGFDRWYYERAPIELWGQPAYAALGLQHERLHRIAARLLRVVAADGPVVVGDFDELLAGNAQLRRRLDFLKQEISDTWRNWDSQTGAYGRSGMLPELRAWGELAKRKVQPCCIVLMGLDHFNEINDSHSHPPGDEVLAGAVRCLTQSLRPFDKVFRYSGDVLLISLPGAELAVGQTVIKCVREALAVRKLDPGSGGSTRPVTASFGLALLDPEVSVEDSIERADQALLLAKTAGGDRAISWDPNVTTGTRLPRLQIEGATE